MKKLGEVEFIEFFLYKDAPHFCSGCYNCFEKGEEFCPHANEIQPIIEAMRCSDGFVFTSPVYVLAETAQMKAFLDHLGYLFIPHRPMEEMFGKVAIVLSTTAGAGTSKAIKTISRSLNFWGVKRVYSLGLKMFALDWTEMNEKKRIKYEKLLASKARKFYYSVLKRKRMSFRLFTWVVFYAMKNMISKYPDEQLDKKYWTNMSWLDKRSPFNK